MESWRERVSSNTKAVYPGRDFSPCIKPLLSRDATQSLVTNEVSAEPSKQKRVAGHVQLPSAQTGGAASLLRSDPVGGRRMH